MDRPKKRDEKTPNKYLNEENNVYNQAHDAWKEYFKHLLSKIPSDERIKNSPAPEYAESYYQGKFDVLMDLICEEIRK